MWSKHRAVALLLTWLVFTIAGTSCSETSSSGPDAADDTAALDVLVEIATQHDTTAPTDTISGVWTGEIPSVEGTWAHLQVKATIADYPMVGPVHVQTVTIYKMTVTQDGADLDLALETCAVLMESESELVTTIIPDQLVDRLPVLEHEASLVPGSGGAGFVKARYYELQGVTLADEASDPLPTEPDDPAVWDQDEDGNPGVTVRVTGIMDGEMYVAQRLWTELEGALTSDGYLDGLVTWEQEQTILGADNPNLMFQPDSVIDPDAAASYFLTTPIEASTTCEAIVAARDELFSR